MSRMVEGSTLVGSLSRMTRSAALPANDYTGEILAALPSGIGRHHPSRGLDGCFLRRVQHVTAMVHGPRDRVLDHPQRANRDDIPVGV
jgi:hypothetical protein